MKTLSLDYLIFGETIIDESFPTAQFNVKNHEIRARCLRDQLGESKIICKEVLYAKDW